jgi:hypothetical protein
MNGPWTFDEAREHCLRASQAQRHAEDASAKASVEYAKAEEAYRVALAKEIVRQHDDEKVAWTVAPDLARGNVIVAGLRRERDIAEGVRDALVQAAWRRSADRKDAQRFADWSQRRELAEGGEGPSEPSSRFAVAA